MRGKLAELKKLNAQLIAVDPHESISAKYFLKQAGLPTDLVHFPLLTDPSLTVSAAYGVAFQMRIHTEVSNRAATFIIDSQGVLRYERRGTTFGDRPSVNDILAELKKL